MIIAAIDPGSKGAVVALDTDSNQGLYHKLKLDKSNMLHDESKAFFRHMRQQEKLSMVFIEKISPNPGWSNKAIFNFGMNYGLLLANIQMLPHTQVAAATWQKKFHKPFKNLKLTPKQRTELSYSKLFPHNPVPLTPRSGKVEEGIMDAFMIAVYGVTDFANCPIQQWGLSKWVG